MPYCGCLLVALVKNSSCLANSCFFCAYNYADKTSIEVYTLHIGSNYLCTNLEMVSLNGSHFSSLITFKQSLAVDIQSKSFIIGVLCILTLRASLCTGPCDCSCHKPKVPLDKNNMLKLIL